MDYQIIELEEFNVIGIRYELSKSLIDNHTWNTGAINLNYSTILNLQSYEMT